VAGSDLFAALAQVCDTGSALVADASPLARPLNSGAPYVDIRAVRLEDSVVCTLRDVTDRHESSRRLAESEERYRLLAENAWDVIWTMAVDGTITYVSPSVERVRGITPDEAARQSLEEIHPPSSAALVRDYFERLYAAMAAGEVPPVYRGEHEYYCQDGSLMLGELQVVPRVDDSGAVVQILGVTRDISDRRAFERELERVSITDPLTGTKNRRHARHLLGEVRGEALASGEPMSLLLIDVDFFKDINDTLGHEAGDHVLQEVTAAVNECLGEHDVLCRWGGDEFVALLRGRTEADGVVLAQDLQRAVSRLSIERVGHLTLSVGVAQWVDGEDRDTWVRRADQAMYAAKAAGRNAVRAASSLAG
jgi:diguanylate cyclase (GGDEF)-like protein/PAS domain S-box-containing protein